jgi:hypothetical protein
MLSERNWGYSVHSDKTESYASIILAVMLRLVIVALTIYAAAGPAFCEDSPSKLVVSFRSSSQTFPVETGHWQGGSGVIFQSGARVRQQPYGFDVNSLLTDEMMTILARDKQHNWQRASKQLLGQEAQIWD